MANVLRMVGVLVWPALWVSWRDEGMCKGAVLQLRWWERDGRGAMDGGSCCFSTPVLYAGCKNYVGVGSYAAWERLLVACKPN